MSRTCRQHSTAEQGRVHEQRPAHVESAGAAEMNDDDDDDDDGAAWLMSRTCDTPFTFKRRRQQRANQ